MPKGNQNLATEQAGQADVAANATIPGLYNTTTANANAAGNVANQNQQLAQSGYTSGQTTGFYDPTQLANIQNLQAQLQKTGGYDPTQLANLNASLGGMAGTGGMNPDQLAQLESGYGAMANTGGYTPQQYQNYLNQATSGTTATMGNLAAAAQRNAAATGGNAGAALASMAQQGGAAQSNATNAALANLNTQINQNKLAGLGGLGTTEAQLAAARQGVAGLQSGLASGVAQGNQNMAAQQAGLAGNVAQGVQGANAGLAGLYSTAAGQQLGLNAQALQGLGLLYGTDLGAAQINASMSRNPGFIQSFVQDLSSLGL